MFNMGFKMVQKDVEELTKQEELVRERLDKDGVRWIKKYVGGGAHFVNWLEQFREVYGEEAVDVEEISSEGFCCFEKGNEKMFRIWVKEKK